MQIYKEVIYDLLTGESYLKIKEHPQKGIYVDGLTEVYIDNKDQILQHINNSQESRFISNTKLNNYYSS